MRENSAENRVNSTEMLQGNSDAVMQGLLAHFLSVNVKVPLPTFDGLHGNTAAFLNRLDKYYIK